MKILIWGTGNFAKEILDNGINGEIIGFVETSKSKDEYKSCPIYDAHSIPAEYDYIVIATVYVKEVYALCRKIGLDVSKLVFMKRTEGIDFNAKPQIRELLGEKNYTIYAAEYGCVEGTFWERDKELYSKLNKRSEFAVNEEFLYPIIGDKYAKNSGMNEYFWQDLWAASYIISKGVKEHYDIGSRVDGFIAHLLAANIKVNMIDVRPFSGEARNLYTIVDDATMMDYFEDNSISSLSALCSLEHFGLGRYGDPIDPEACFKCFKQIQKKLKKGGTLYISLPVGRDSVQFNAHRIFYADTIIKNFDQLNLLEYSVIKDRKIQCDVDIHEYDHLEYSYLTGLFRFEKK